MSIKNFKNPWTKGAEYYPDWLGGEKVLGKSAISDDSETSQNEEDKDKYDSIDVIIYESSIQGVQQMNFVKTHKAIGSPNRLQVRYLDIDGTVLWTGNNFKTGTLEYELFNKEREYYDVESSEFRKWIILDGPFKTRIVQEKFWIAWKRYSIQGERKTEKEVGEQFGPHARSWRAFERNRLEPNSLLFFTAFFENHSVTKIINQTEVNRIIQDIYNTFENDGRLKVHAVDADLSVRKVGFVVVGYHSPEPTNNTGLNNTELAIGRAKTVQKLLLQKLSSIQITSIGAISGGDSQEFGARPAITYLGAKEFIDQLGIPYTPPTIGE